jgi:hypothetical protein
MPLSHMYVCTFCSVKMTDKCTLIWFEPTLKEESVNVPNPNPIQKERKVSTHLIHV